MERNKPIAELEVYDEIEGFYILKSASARATAAGKPFLSAVLADRTGEIDAVIWEYNGSVREEDAGQVIKVQGSVSEYRGARQLKISRYRLATETDPVDMTALVPAADLDPEAAMEEIRTLIAGLEDEDYRTLCETLFERHAEEFSVIPAAKSIHHSFRSGLLMHTLNMLHLADVLASQYPETVDRSLLLAGTLLHDFGKVREFNVSELGLVKDYSVPGHLLGHLVMGAQEIAETAEMLGIPEEKSILLQHMVLSHHGEPEFGAAVRPACAEAELLSYIDMIDSRMEIYREELENVPAGEFSGKVFGLDRKIYRHG